MFLGCGREDGGNLQKQPRPVEVQQLKLQPPPKSSLATASVASWKSEEIGFEVGGRVEWVAEPNEEIEGRIEDASGKLLIRGAPIARIESERYQLKVEQAKAEVARANQSLAAAKIEYEKGLPAQINAGKAEEQLARAEFNRINDIKSAVSETEIDQARANLLTATAKLQQLDATLLAKAAEVQSLESSLMQAKQSQRDAERNLEDCTLYSSFRGQISEVNAVPGSVVQAGEPVAKIQMMDPIKIELEVSAEDTRRLRNRETLPVILTQANGEAKRLEGFLYLIDLGADAATRTYTLTLLLINEKLAGANYADDPKIATTNQTWRLNFKFLPGTQNGALFVFEDAILTDEKGPFLWKVENAEAEKPLPANNLLKVSKMRIRLGEARAPFLGNWIFRHIEVDDPTFDPDINLVVGKLNVNQGEPQDWNGDTVFIESDTQWMLRPGDLVSVDLSGADIGSGYFVPMDAIVHDAGRTYLFVVEGGESASEDASTVKRTEIKIVTDPATATSSLLQVESMNGESLDGVRYVTRGVHYLREGESVHVVHGNESISSDQEAGE